MVPQTFPASFAPLFAWSAAGTIWGLAAWRLAAAARATPPAAPDAGPDAPAAPLSVFKPLPRLDAATLDAVEEGLGSFLAQLGPDDELLVGIHEADRERARPLLDRLGAAHPGARLRPLFASPSTGPANPKIAWQRLLAREAKGELWMWSDADIVAPPGFLAGARAEFARARRDGCLLLTFPYAVRRLPAPATLLTALFVNVEFYPGVLLLRRLGPVDFGLGAALLFRRDDFRERADWDELEGSLADDFALGRALRPARIGSTVLETRLEAATWPEALRHYLRCQKTIRWCRPLGFAAQLLILPVLGWLGAVLLHPGLPLAWAGLAGTVLLEIALAGAASRAAGLAPRLRDLPAAGAWSLLRSVVWVACWTPWPVVWRSTVWWSPRLAPSEAE